MSSRSVVESILSALGADADFRDEILGDLAEEFAERAQRDGVGAARLWYYEEAVRAVPHLLRNWYRRTGTRGVRAIALSAFVSLFAVAAFGVAARLLLPLALTTPDVPLSGPAGNIALTMPGLLIGLGSAVAAGYLSARLYRPAPLVASGALALVWLAFTEASVLITPDALPPSLRLTIMIIIGIGPLLGGLLRGYRVVRET